MLLMPAGLLWGSESGAGYFSFIALAREPFNKMNCSLSINLPPDFLSLELRKFLNWNFASAAEWKRTLIPFM